MSVVIITYNGMTWLPTAIQSVLAQTYGDLEVIIVEDGSKDGADEYVKSCADSRLKYIWKPNGGLSSARNAGIRASQGKYCAFLDCDDWWTPGKIERQLAALARSHSARWCYSACQKVSERGELIQVQVPDKTTDLLRNLLAANVITGSASSVIAERSLLIEAGLFDETIAYAEDWECWLRLAKLSLAATVDDVDVTLLVRESSFGKNTLALYSTALNFIQRTFDTLPEEYRDCRKRSLAQVFYSASIDAAMTGKRTAAVRYLLAAIRRKPSTIAYWKRLVLAPRWLF